MITVNYTRRILEAWKKSDRNGLVLSECLQDFYASFKDIIDLQEMQAKEIGDWFEEYLRHKQKPTEIEEKTDATGNVANDAMLVAIQEMKTQGLSNRKIAEQLSVSEATIRRKLKL